MEALILIALLLITQYPPSNRVCPSSSCLSCYITTSLLMFYIMIIILIYNALKEVLCNTVYTVIMINTLAKPGNIVFMFVPVSLLTLFSFVFILFVFSHQEMGDTMHVDAHVVDNIHGIMVL